MKLKSLPLLLSIILFAFLPFFFSAEEVIDNDFGYSLDIPEGYKVIGYTPDGTSYQFQHSKIPVNLVLKLYLNGQYNKSRTALKETLDKLSAQYDNIDSFYWNDKICSITTFKSTSTNPAGSKGWAISTPLSQEENKLVLLCYADEKVAASCEQFMISTLNSLEIGDGSKRKPGIITSYAYPGAGEKEVFFDIAEKHIRTTIDSEDSQANQFVIDCEFAVLKLYANDEKWKEAWQRYYRLIFRDSYSRLDKAAEDIRNTLNQLTLKSKKEEEVILNELLLNWVQNMDYTRETKASEADFTSVIDILCGKGSDCDSRSLLLCCLMEHYGIKSELFISKIYSHAVYGLDLNLSGAKINVHGIDFLLNETTAKNIKPGLIAQDQSKTENWIPVDLP
ncbi:MAG: hypothetical protein K6F15_09345 [Treponema sp.]|nr:hypothetical protein [Treponema sp.]